ncbi:MAG: hypothetical protein SFT93_01055 [Rickettsiaceae bacterium]|nr:hypothetical protein [Rickettsiaceae bacterium]
MSSPRRRGSRKYKDWIPACAGMTKKETGMTKDAAGMTEKSSGNDKKGEAGMTKTYPLKLDSLLRRYLHRLASPKIHMSNLFWKWYHGQNFKHP